MDFVNLTKILNRGFMLTATIFIKKKPTAKSQRPIAKNIKMTLFVGNLSREVNEFTLEQLFSQFGEVIACKIMYDRYSRESRGFGFVTFDSPVDAQKAIDTLNEHEMWGKKLKVSEAKPK